jgi:hypothetical protein
MSATQRLLSQNTVRPDADQADFVSGHLDRRASVYPAAISRAGLAILAGPQGYHTADLEYLRSSRPNIFFALGMQCLRLA